MKQSTKLLCLVLSLIMAFSCFSVIGSASLVEGGVAYDRVDDAALTPEQVADLALDMVDDLLLDADILLDITVVTLDLRSIDAAFSSLVSTTDGFIWAIAKGLLGTVGDLSFSALKNGDSAYQRSGGDLQIIYQLLQFIADNAGNLSKVAYGIDNGDGSLELGLISSFLDLGDIGDLLNDIPGFLKETVYDLLIYGSYNATEVDNDYSYMSLDDLEKAGTTYAARYPEMNSLDNMAINALYNLLTKPQEYSWVETGETDPETGDPIMEKVWDTETGAISPTFAAMDATEAKALINPLSKSLFAILDGIAQIAIDDFGVTALNNNLKKALMEACEVEFIEIADAETSTADELAAILPSEVKAVFDNEAAYTNYIAYDCIKKASNGTWYYTTLKSRPYDDNGDGENDTDPETGDELSRKTRVYYKANFGAANEFASLINWDWQFCTSTGTTGTKLLYGNASTPESLLGTDGTIVGGLNWLLGLVYDTALTQATKDKYLAELKAAGLVDSTTTRGWIAGDNSKLGDNITNLVKYILTQYGEKVFGKGSAYASYTMDDLKDKKIIDMVAMIGPEFFEDAMPQIILPKQNGEYAFATSDAQGNSVALWQFAAIVLRELITGIAPNVNYDEFIFANGDVTSASDRLFATHTADEWFKIIANMGIDLGYTYLDQITNFDATTAAYDFKTAAITDGRWESMLDTVILWAVDYIGEGDYGVLAGINPNNIAQISGPLNKLSYVLNSILPLGMIGVDYYTADIGGKEGIDLNKIVDGFKKLLTSFDLTVITKLFGRNMTGYNLLGSKNLVTSVLKLVNDILSLVLGTTVLQAVVTEGDQSLDAVVEKANLATTINNLLTGLNGRKADILVPALPVVAKFISEWGGEQEFATPTIGVGSTYITPSTTSYFQGDQTSTSGCDTLHYYYADGSKPLSFEVSNNTEGVWRHYKDASGADHYDKQYEIQVTNFNVTDANGDDLSWVDAETVVDGDKIPYGGSATITMHYGKLEVGTDQDTGTGDKPKVGGEAYMPDGGGLARLNVTYRVFDENGIDMGVELVRRQYVFFTNKNLGEGKETERKSNSVAVVLRSPYAVDYRNISRFEDLTTANVERTYGAGQNLTKQNFEYTVKSTPELATKAGLVLSSTSGSISSQVLALIETTIASPVQGFATKSYEFRNSDNEVKGTFTTSGSVPKQEDFEKNVTIEEVGDQDGYVMDYTISFGGGGDSRIDGTARFIIYDGEGRENLLSLVGDELSAVRLKNEYKQSGKVTVNKELVSADSGTNIFAEDFELRETNFTEVDAEGNTVIDCAQAWTTYFDALMAAIPMAQDWCSDMTRYDFRKFYNDLRVAVNDIEYCRATAEDGVETLDTEIDALEAKLKELSAESTDKYDFTDYKMYRLNRYNDNRDEANYLIGLRKDAAIQAVEDIDEYFDYNWMEENNFRALVENNSNKTLLLALLESYDADEIDAKEQWLKNRKQEYLSKRDLDVVMASNLLQITHDRLLYRTTDASGNKTAINTQLVDEVSSAMNMIGDANNGRYTAQSWANYADALAKAQAAQTSDSQMTIFDSKYNLLVARKRLVPVAEAADYTELEALIGQAEQALANMNLYDNTDKEFGQVLAELGMDPIEHADGYDVQLFPGSAYLTLERGYGADDQKKIDNAAKALKEALARLKFKNTEVKLDGVAVDDEVLVEADEEKGIEAVMAKIAHIAADQNAEAVKALFTVEGTTVDEITVSNDINYTIETELKGFAGTNSTVTFYQTSGDVKIPVATIKIIVDGDINGDGTVDVLDASYAQLVSVEQKNIEGIYLLAGDLAGEAGVLDADDYSQIVSNMLA